MDSELYVSRGNQATVGEGEGGMIIRTARIELYASVSEKVPFMSVFG